LQEWRIRLVKPWIHPGARVLDIGCFDDSLFRRLGDQLGFGIGLDPLLKEPLYERRFRLLPGTFPQSKPSEGLFDVITMLAVLEHVVPHELRRWAETCRDLLNPKGLVIVTVPSPRVDTLLDVLMRLRLAEGMSVEEHHGFEPSMAVQLFEQTGFHTAHRSRFQLGLNNLFVFRKQ
jgi:cyclopropane fatty-acyl-phospholipid synthase-like methyltransferase